MPISKDWTHEELLNELRRRERAARAPKRGAAPAPAPGRGRDLADVATDELTRVVRRRQRVVYGIDDRLDVYQVTAAPIRRVAEAVVALVKASDLRRGADGAFALRTESYREAYDLCSSEAFVSQPIGCFCSGFLVAPDVVATAGHCVKNDADLRSMRFVFGFRMQSATTPTTTFGADDVYAGKTLIGRKLTESGTDWALVRLDRPVVGREPVSVRTTGKIPERQKLFVIGHLCGLPQKFAPGAIVRDNSSASHFVANLDTYGGNSGSPVFNASTRKVEGILVRGETDFVSSGRCNVSLVCPTTGCRGEDVTRAAEWVGKIPKTTTPMRQSSDAGKRRAKARRRSR
jgi:hypothetical protein